MTNGRQPPRARAERRIATPAGGSPAVPYESGEYLAVRRLGARQTGGTPSRGAPTSERSRVTSIRERRATPTGEVRREPARFSSRAQNTQDEDLFSSGHMLDEDLDFEIDIDTDGALELDCLPSSHRPRVEQPRQTNLEPPSVSAPVSPRRTGRTPTGSRAIRVPPTTGAQPAPRRTPSGSNEVDTHASLVAFSGFGESPEGLLGTPAYAFRVISRRRTLRAGLARAKFLRSQDVGLYEAALRTADDGAVRMGLVLTATLVTLGLVFLAAVVHVAAPLLATL